MATEIRTALRTGGHVALPAPRTVAGCMDECLAMEHPSAHAIAVRE